ncbi:MAG: diphthine synthase [Thermoplasmataceae archaeon]
MIYVLGIGLRGYGSMTIDEINIISRCKMVFLESYTSVIDMDRVEEISKKIGKPLTRLDRESLENPSRIISLGRIQDVCILVTGDPLIATTHSQLRFDAMQAGVGIEFYENASILTRGPALTGLYIYRFGPVVSLPAISKEFKPKSVLIKIKRNLENEMHTLLLFDLANNKTMSPSDACNTLVSLEQEHRIGAISPDTHVIVLNGISTNRERLLYGTIESFIAINQQGSPSCMIIPATLSDTERKFLEAFTEKI